MAEHSPLPWRVVAREGWVDDIVDAAENHVFCSGHDYDAAGYMSPRDADHVVRCVNSHDDLLAALKAHDAYMLRVGYVGPSDRALHPEAAENWVRVREAIAKAEGRQ